MLRRFKPFDVKLCYTDLHRLPEQVERELGVTFYESAAEMVPHCDVVTINAPLYPGTEGLFDDELIATMKRGALHREYRAWQNLRPGRNRRQLRAASWRGMRAMSGSRSPRPRDHPWRSMPPSWYDHTSPARRCRRRHATRLKASAILECWFENRPIREGT